MAAAKATKLSSGVLSIEAPIDGSSRRAAPPLRIPLVQWCGADSNSLLGVAFFRQDRASTLISIPAVSGQSPAREWAGIPAARRGADLIWRRDVLEEQRRAMGVQAVNFDSDYSKFRRGLIYQTSRPMSEFPHDVLSGNYPATPTSTGVAAE